MNFVEVICRTVKKRRGINTAARALFNYIID